MAARFAWVWTFVGFGVGLLLGFNFAADPSRPLFDATTVVLGTLAGLIVSILVFLRSRTR